VLEAGGRICSSGHAVGIEAAVGGGAYRATTEGRAFGLGGTTSRWGGQLVPHSDLDFRAPEAEAFDPWQHIVGVVRRHSEDVAAMLGLRPMCDWFGAPDYLPTRAADALRSRGLEIVTADWIPFRKRNLSFLLNTPGAANERLTVFLNAAAASWSIRRDSEDSARIACVTACVDNRAIAVRARAFVLAAGAIESTRILLEMQRQSGMPFKKGAALGHYLSDHLSCRVADVSPEDRKRCAEVFGPRFRAGRMRSFRFVERTLPQEAPRCFFHFIYENVSSGFALARKALLGLQSRAVPNVSFGEIASGLTGLAGLAWSRFVRKRLHIPEGTPVHLQLDIEQQPDASNRVELSDGLDAAGRPKAIVRWNTSEADADAIREAASRFLARWPGLESAEGLKRGHYFPRLEPALGDAAGSRPYDVYHPVGTCRMGVDHEAVVAPDLGVYGATNLSVVSTAVFPSAGTANPTFSMFCLAAALAEKLARDRDAVCRSSLDQ
jgi:choline dehydrogenase-like flavoprotein